MDRAVLVDKLKLVAPAVAGNDTVPALAHYWFTGDKLMAYDDRIAISVPLETEWQAAVPSSILAFLTLSRHKAVEFSLSDDLLYAKTGTSKVKLGTLPPEQFLFEMPGAASGAALGVDVKALVMSLEECLCSISHDSMDPQRLGVTLMMGEDKELHLFTTNSSTLTHSRLPLKTKATFKGAVILSEQFCGELIRLSKAMPLKKCALEIHNDYALFTTPDAILFGKLLVPGDSPIPWFEICAAAFSAKQRKSLVEVPSKLELMVKRAILVTDSRANPTFTLVKILDGKLRFFSHSNRGEVDDSLTLPSDKILPITEAEVNPKHLDTGLKHYDHMFIHDKCFVMANESTDYLVSMKEVRSAKPAKGKED